VALVNKGENIMKAMISLIVAALLCAGLTGCTASPKKPAAKVFCPTCGAEFHPPLSGL
jgi:hypothetical protein